MSKGGASTCMQDFITAKGDLITDMQRFDKLLFTEEGNAIYKADIVEYVYALFNCVMEFVSNNKDKTKCIDNFKAEAAKVQSTTPILIKKKGIPDKIHVVKVKKNIPTLTTTSIVTFKGVVEELRDSLKTLLKLTSHITLPDSLGTTTNKLFPKDTVELDIDFFTTRYNSFH